MSEPTSFSEKLALAKARQGESAPALSVPKPPPIAPPRVTFLSGSGSPQRDVAVDSAVDGLDIISAYNKYAGKGMVADTGKTDGIMISCPNPSHPDRHPSAWINTDKQTWYCSGCDKGGDKFDIAAWHFGMPVPGYKDGKNFHELRKRIAIDAGVTFQKTMVGTVAVAAPAVGPRPEVVVAEEIETLDGRKLHLVRESTPIMPIYDVDADVIEMPGPISTEEVEDIELKWREILPEGTFLDTWMQNASLDDVPEEYHFWNGLLAISMTLGRDVTLRDFLPVYGNLFICILGRTGSGKSRAKRYLDQLLEETMPYSTTDPYSKGVLRLAGLASAEALIWMFKKEIEDPTLPAGSGTKSYPVRGIIDYNELSQLVGRSQRMGNVLSPTLMQFYDMEDNVETVSRTHGIEKATMPFASAITTSQPKSLRTLLTATDAASGFLNRWFFVAGKQKERAAIGGVLVDITPSIKPLQRIQGWASTAGTLEWSQEASDKFTDFFKTELHPTMKKDDTDLLNRIDLLCKKLVLLLTANMRDKEVSLAAVEQMMLIYPYLIECYGIPGAHVGATMQNEIRENIVRVIVAQQSKTAGGVTARDITRRLASKKYPLDLFHRTMKYMIEIEEVVALPSDPSLPGRPTVRYGVPELSEYETTPAPPTAPRKGMLAVES